MNILEVRYEMLKRYSIYLSCRADNHRFRVVKSIRQIQRMNDPAELRLALWPLNLM